MTTPQEHPVTSTETRPARRAADADATDGARYTEHVANLRRALEVAGGRLDPQVAEHARAVLAGADERLALGVDHTIVALAGGTGSGKSSTFNAVSRLTFADVGVRRPTTARVTACSWSDDATPLLDWLEVDPERRISRDSELDGAEEAPLAGLILLDLPDHDSIASAHREIVDRILPLVDLLIWIVDPQKYADEALHAGYLQSFVGAEASMIVVLNQIDTVAASGRDALVADVSRLLREDGLVGVDVRAVSARTGEGIDELRETLRDAVSRRSVAARRLADELDREGRRIAEEVPPNVLVEVAPLVSGEVDRVAVAVGVQAVADDVRASVRSGRASSRTPQFRSPQESAVRVIRSRWLSKVTDGMRPAWAQSVDDAVPDQESLSASLLASLDDVPVDATPSARARSLRTAAWWVLGAAALAVVFAVLVVVEVLDLDQTLAAIGAAAAVAAGLVAVVLLLVGSRVRSAAAEERAETVRSAALSALRSAVEATLARPAQTVLDEHRTVRESALSVRDSAARGATPSA